MEIEFDPDKDRINRAKHGISLAAAAALFRGDTIEEIDERFSYGEERLIATGLIGGRVYRCAYALRGGVARIISLYEATRREADDDFRET